MRESRNWIFVDLFSKGFWKFRSVCKLFEEESRSDTTSSCILWSCLITKRKCLLVRADVKNNYELLYYQRNNFHVFFIIHSHGRNSVTWWPIEYNTYDSPSFLNAGWFVPCETSNFPSFFGDFDRMTTKRYLQWKKTCERVECRWKSLHICWSLPP